MRIWKKTNRKILVVSVTAVIATVGICDEAFAASGKKAPVVSKPAELVTLEASLAQLRKVNPKDSKAISNAAYRAAIDATAYEGFLSRVAKELQAFEELAELCAAQELLSAEMAAAARCSSRVSSTAKLGGPAGSGGSKPERSRAVGSDLLSGKAACDQSTGGFGGKGPLQADVPDGFWGLFFEEVRNRATPVGNVAQGMVAGLFRFVAWENEVVADALEGAEEVAQQADGSSSGDRERATIVKAAAKGARGIAGVLNEAADVLDSDLDDKISEGIVDAVKALDPLPTSAATPTTSGTSNDSGTRTGTNQPGPDQEGIVSYAERCESWKKTAWMTGLVTSPEKLQDLGEPFLDDLCDDPVVNPASSSGGRGTSGAKAICETPKRSRPLDVTAPEKAVDQPKRVGDEGVPMDRDPLAVRRLDQGRTSGQRPTCRGGADALCAG